jgi:hypothetical protein
MLVFALLAQVATASPRIIPTQSNLLSRADLVITATYVTTEETEERRRIGQHDARRILAHFRIDCVMKGTPTGTEVIVGHYLQPPSDSPLDAVRISTQHFSFLVFSNTTEKYLIYLKEQGEGVYAPVTGEIDPQFSFWNLEYKGATIAEPAAGAAGGPSAQP